MERGNSIEIEYWKRDETLWTKLTLRVLKSVLLKSSEITMTQCLL